MASREPKQPDPADFGDFPPEPDSVFEAAGATETDFAGSAADFDSGTEPPESPPGGYTSGGPRDRRTGMQPDQPPIVFLDMAERDAAERQRLADRQFTLEMQRRNQGGRLVPELAAEYKANEELLQSGSVLDPLFNHLRETLARIHAPDMPVGDHIDGKLPSQQPPVEPLTDRETELAAAYGLLEADNLTNPDLPRFVPGVSIVLGEYTQSQDLFVNVLQIMANEGERGGEKLVRASQWAAVVRTLRNEGVLATDPLLGLKTRSALAGAAGVDETSPPSSLNIDLPDLEAQTDLEIVADNLRAMQAIYFAAMLEEVKMFQVVDKLVEFFQNGMLPLGKGVAGDGLYDYWKKSVTRLSEVERRNLYARTLGRPGGEPTTQHNRELQDLWLRFVSAVSSFVRQYTVEDLLRANVPMPVNQEQVRKAGRDLAANLTLHGYGVAWFAATELQNTINDVIGLLSDPEIKAAYGARDMWQVIDQVATLELGGAKNSVQYRTLATSGAIIIRWLAERANLLAAASQVQIIDLSQITTPVPRTPGTKPTVNPTDRDLIDACEQYLAVTGTQETSVEQYAQPTEPTPTTSLPIQIPQAARDLLASVGVTPDVVAPHQNGSARN